MDVQLWVKSLCLKLFIDGHSGLVVLFIEISGKVIQFNSQLLFSDFHWVLTTHNREWDLFGFDRLSGGKKGCNYKNEGSHADYNSFVYKF